jgi:hypothetical protein
MATFAVVGHGTVVNVILAESEEIAAEVTGMDVIEMVDGVPGMSWVLHDDGWRPPAPYPSWEWNGAHWLPPIPYPTGDPNTAYTWDEEQGDWVEVVEPKPVTE